MENYKDWIEKVKQIFRDHRFEENFVENIDNAFQDMFDDGFTPKEAFEEELSRWGD